jgi:hypothetical protein
MNLTDTLLLVFGWSAPLLILLLVGLAFVGWKIYQVLSAIRIEDPSVKWFAFAGVAGFFLLTVFACLVCYRVHPTEAFQDVSASTSSEEEEPTANDPTLPADLASAEDAVCKLITRVDQFLQNDVGPAGQSDSQLILAAQMKARDGVSMVDCSAAESETSDIESRLSRLESTLKSFTGPELQRTYDTTMRCEGFQDLVTSVELTPRQRLTAIQATIRDQQIRLLAPVDQKTEDLKRGIASDCDKKRAAARVTPSPTITN